MNKRVVQKKGPEAKIDWQFKRNLAPMMMVNPNLGLARLKSTYITHTITRKKERKTAAWNWGNIKQKISFIINDQ